MSESPVGVPGLVVSCASFDVTQELKGIFHVSTGWPHDLVSRLPAQLFKCLKVPQAATQVSGDAFLTVLMVADINNTAAGQCLIDYVHGPVEHDIDCPIRILRAARIKKWLA
ncbi:MAG: hypothetical protein ACOYES_03180 [Bacillota bacterium]